MTDVILSLGSDALINQWQVLFPKGIPGGSHIDAVRLRIDKTFTMPQKQIATYEIDFRGAKLLKTAKKEDTDKTITFSVRVDQPWAVYDDLEAWHNLCYNPVTNTASSDADTRIPIVLQNLDQNNAIAKSFTFSYCKLKDMKVSDWDMASSEPVSVELTIIFGYFQTE